MNHQKDNHNAHLDHHNHHYHHHPENLNHHCHDNHNHHHNHDNHLNHDHGHDRHLEKEENSFLTAVAPLTNAHAVFHLSFDHDDGGDDDDCGVDGGDDDDDLWELLNDVVDLGRSKPHSTWVQSAIAPDDDHVDVYDHLVQHSHLSN